MDPQRRTLALVSAATALTATGLFAATGPASADQGKSHVPGVARVHELSRDGDPGTTCMHGLVREGNPGMAHMHERMMNGSAMHSPHSD